MFFKKHTTLHAPEFPQETVWLNGGPQSLRHASSKVTMVYFWNTACFFCLSTLEQVKRWHALYEPFGLRVLGVQSPEFPFEKKSAYVASRLQELEIPFPVALDTEHEIGKRYQNTCSPCIYLINNQGELVYTHVGANGYPQTEFALQSALHEAGVKSLPSIGPDHSMGGTVFYPRSKEIYGGYLRGTLGNHQTAIKDKHTVIDQEEAFTDAGNHQENTLYLHGHWAIHAESIEHTRHLSSVSEYVCVRYRAHRVFMVMSSENPVSCRVEMNNQPIPADIRGRNVTEEASGQTAMIVKSPGLYHIINAEVFHQGTLKVFCSEPGVHVYAVTFG